jgi:NADH-quinone oxidoreductase subunit C
MAIENSEIQEKLQEKFGENVKYFRTEYDMFVLEADVDVVYNVIKFLKEEPSLNFHFLTDLCGVHYPDSTVEEQYCVVYHMHNWFENKRIRIKTFLNGNNPEVKSITSLFHAADWQERETYDFYGIQFKGHPNLVRILNMDEMVSFPMRKEFPMEDTGRTDKDDRFFGRTINNTSLN